MFGMAMVWYSTVMWGIGLVWQGVVASSKG